jgi:hypothetical protein
VTLRLTLFKLKIIIINFYNKNTIPKSKKTRQFTRQFKAIHKAIHKAIQGNSRQFKTIQGNSRQFKAIQGNTRQYKAIYKAIYKG